MAEYSELKKIFLISIGGSLGLSALIAIFVFIIGNFGELELRVLGSVLIIALFSVTSLACAALWERGTFTIPAIIGFVGSIGGFVTLELMIWGMDAEFLWRFALVFTVASIAAAHSSLLIIMGSKDGITGKVMYATLAVIWIIAALIAFAIFTELEFLVSGVALRIIGVLAVLNVTGTIATPILKKVLNPGEQLLQPTQNL